MATAIAPAQVQRGEQSWTYIYIFLGFALTIEAAVIQMFNLDAVSNLILYIPVVALTWYLFLHDGWFHNRLTGWKNSREEKWRSPSFFQ